MDVDIECLKRIRILGNSGKDAGLTDLGNACEGLAFVMIGRLLTQGEEKGVFAVELLDYLVFELALAQAKQNFVPAHWEE